MSGLRLLSANVDVLTETKLAELRVLVTECRADVIALSEVFPKSGTGAPVLRLCLVLTGYEVVWPDETSGRGVVLLVRSGISFSPFPLPSSSAVGVRLALPGSSVLVVSWYRSPRSSAGDCSSLAACVRLVCALTCPSVFLGDLNLPGVDWVLGSGNCPLVARPLLSAILDECLEQMVVGPTRARSGCRPSLLDVVLVSSSSLVLGVERRPPLGLSDHDVILVDVSLTVSGGPSRRPVFQWRRARWEPVCLAISSVDWEREMRERGIDGYLDYFVEVLLGAVREFVPRVQCSGPRSAPWIGPRCLRALASKRRAWASFRSCGSSRSWDLYRECRSRAARVVRYERERFERTVALRLSGSPRAFWGFVRSRTAPVAAMPVLATSDGRMGETPREKSALLSSYFSSVFVPASGGGIPAAPCPLDPTGLMVFDPPDVSEVEAALRGLHMGKAAGPDGLVPEMLSPCASSIAPPLSVLYRESLRLGRLPRAWKSATVVPVYKAGPRGLVSSYRPISLTSVLCRVLERLLWPQLYGFFEGVGVICDEQFGFRPGRSPCSLLLDEMSSWISAAEKGCSVDCVYLDLRKAFDRVPHDRLLSRIVACGVGGVAFEWLRDFLVGRIQRVQVSGSLSDAVPVLSGVPQGSVLGPLLFLVSVWDLPRVVGDLASVRLYADDSRIWRMIRTDEDRSSLQSALDAVCRWASESALVEFSVEKCVSLSLFSDGPPTPYLLRLPTGDIPLHPTVSEKDLGVRVDHSLGFSDHVRDKVAKARSVLGVIARCFRHLDSSSFLLLYKSLVRPHLEYCSPVWGSVGFGMSDLIESVQRRATRLVPALRGLPYSERLRRIGLVTLAYRRFRADLLAARGFLSSPDLVGSRVFSLRPQDRTRGHSRMLEKVRHRTRVGKRFFSSRVGDFWNALPERCVSAPTVNVFKAELNGFFEGFPLKFDHLVRTARFAGYRNGWGDMVWSSGHVLAQSGCQQ